MFGPDKSRRSIRNPEASITNRVGILNASQEEPVIPSNLMFDRRIIRGNTWAASLHAQPSESSAKRQASPQKTVARKKSEETVASKTGRYSKGTTKPRDDSTEGRQHVQVQTGISPEELEVLQPEVDVREAAVQKIAVEELEQLKNNMEQLRAEKQVLEAEKAAAVAQISLLQAAHDTVQPAQQTPLDNLKRDDEHPWPSSEVGMEPAPVYSNRGEDELDPGLRRPLGVYAEVDSPSQSPSASMSEADSILSDQDCSYQAAQQSAIADRDMHAGSDQGRNPSENLQAESDQGRNPSENLQGASASSQAPNFHDAAGGLPSPSAYQDHLDSLDNAAGRSEPGRQAHFELLEQPDCIAANRACDEQPSEVQEAQPALPPGEGPPENLPLAVFGGHADGGNLEQVDSTPNFALRDEETVVLPGFCENGESADGPAASALPPELHSHAAILTASQQASIIAKAGSSSSSVDKGMSEAVLLKPRDVKTYSAGHFPIREATATDSSSETKPACLTEDSAPRARIWMPSESLSEVQSPANSKIMPSTKCTAGSALMGGDPTAPEVAHLPSPIHDRESETGAASLANLIPKADDNPPEPEVAVLELSTRAPYEDKSDMLPDVDREGVVVADEQIVVSEKFEESRQAVLLSSWPAKNDKVQDPLPEQSNALQTMVSDPTGQMQEVEMSKVEQPHKLHIEIANPAGEIVPNLSSEINEDDWLPDLTVQDPGHKHWETSSELSASDMQSVGEEVYIHGGTVEESPLNPLHAMEGFKDQAGPDTLALTTSPALDASEPQKMGKTEAEAGLCDGESPLQDVATPGRKQEAEIMTHEVVSEPEQEESAAVPEDSLWETETDTEHLSMPQAIEPKSPPLADDSQPESLLTTYIPASEQAILATNLGSSVADSAEATEPPADAVRLNNGQTSEPADNTEAAALQDEIVTELTRPEAAVSETEAAVDSPPVTIRLSFSIEPQKYDVPAEHAPTEHGAGSNERFTEEKHVLDDRNPAFTKIAESPGLVGLEQEKDEEDDLEDCSLPSVDIQHTEDPNTPSEATAEGMLDSADSEENVVASEDETTQLQELSKRDVKLKDAEFAMEMTPFTLVTHPSALMPEIMEPEQISRMEGEAECLQLHIRKHIEPDFGSSKTAQDAEIAKAHLDLEGIPEVSEAEDDEYTDSVGGAQLSLEPAIVDEESDKEVLPPKEGAGIVDDTAEQESKSPSNAELPEVLAGELDPAGKSVEVDSVQRDRDLHQEHQITAISDSDCHHLISASGEGVNDEVEKTNMSNAEASLVKDIWAANIQEPRAERGEAIAMELWQMKTQEEDGPQEMTASQKRVTFQLPDVEVGHLQLEQQSEVLYSNDDEKKVTTEDEGHLLPKSSGGKGFKIEVSAQGLPPELTDTTAEEESTDTALLSELA